MNSSALKHNVNTRGCQIGMEASGKIYICFLSGAEAVSLCGDPSIHIQLGRLASEPVAMSGTHVLESQGFGHPTMSNQLLWLSSAGTSSMIGLPSDGALKEADDIQLISGIAKSCLTTSSSPSPPARISLLKILELEVLKFMLLKDFTHAMRSGGRKPSDECMFLGEYVSCFDNGDDTKLRVMGNISVGADGSSNCMFFKDVLLVRRGTYDEAREYVERARSCWATELAALVLESYRSLHQISSNSQDYKGRQRNTWNKAGKMIHLGTSSISP
ncbi:hypothetical protein Nepgr_010557 [Nepenthes gracilis]|uniref:PIK-related kinase FAT domain-containing protein n=1 Tax=Nepenthes gracilis TaxID=150966 RepID=A0AAD3SDN0_NEPGR|nr:hypothetical protein Nepgr_010557 [Nepenthes gracilis]